jgi:phosphoribosylaminoimidazolecarboxamide formyltransferase/IMP cyclohydrolase
LDENWDRIVRNEREFGERWEYIESNPGRAGLGDHYEFLWLNHEGWEQLADYNRRFEIEPIKADRLESRSHRTQADRLEGRSHRIQTDRLESRSHRTQTDRLESRSHNTRERRTVVFIKHMNACGVGVAEDAETAYRRAYLGDPNAAMGGILCVDFPVDAAFADIVMNTYQRIGKGLGDVGLQSPPSAFFIEVWLAPKFEDEAVRIIRSRKAWGQRVRILSLGDLRNCPSGNDMEYRAITGGMLVQSRDLLGLNENQWRVVTQREPTETEMNDLRLAWLVCKHTKSNAISICKDGMLIGNGAGQMSRVMSCRIATWLAKENGHEEALAGSVAASDAFFPFRDGPDILMDAGVSAIIQPGGSKRDADTIAACDERGVAMVFTGTRHFKH